MAWLDSRIWCHPKVAEVSKSTRWCYVAAIAYSDGFHTEGRLSRAQLRTLDVTANERRSLITAGLWTDDGEGGIFIHDWKDHNGDRDEKRLQARERQRRKRQKDADLSRVTERDTVRDGSVTDSVTTGVTNSVTGPRAGARPMTGDRVKGEKTPRHEPATTGPTAEAGLTRATLEQPAPAAHDTPKPIDALGRLVADIRDRDTGTHTVLRRNYGGLPEAAFHYAREELLEHRPEIDSDAAYVTAILQRIADTGDIGDPNHAPPPPTTPAAAKTADQLRPGLEQFVRAILVDYPSEPDVRAELADRIRPEHHDQLLEPLTDLWRCTHLERHVRTVLAENPDEHAVTADLAAKAPNHPELVASLVDLWRGLRDPQPGNSQAEGVAA